MKIEEIENKIKKIENLFDQYVLPENYIIVRLDGKGFSKFTKDKLKLNKPFDERFHEAMKATTLHLFKSGFKILYAYTQSDEISLLIAKEDFTYSRKVRKINSILAGDTSAFFSLYFNTLAIFDSRTICIANKETIIDYFCWRQEDAYRNALSGYCYWTLRNQGISSKVATQQIDGLSISDKNELLFQNGINFNELPSWQKRGVAFYNSKVDKKGVNPLNNEEIYFTRNVVQINNELPIKEAYRDYLSTLLS